MYLHETRDWSKGAGRKRLSAPPFADAQSEAKRLRLRRPPGETLSAKERRLESPLVSTQGVTWELGVLVYGKVIFHKSFPEAAVHHCIGAICVSYFYD